MLNIRGALTAMITPFNGGKLDEARLRQQIEAQIAGGIDGLVPVGTTGESPTVDFAEHEKIIRITVETAAKRVPVIAGTGANATTEALELHRFAREVGADACLSVNPYYNKPTQEGLYRHFMTLADKIDLPIVLYNIPGRTGITMTPATVARLAQDKHFIAIKEATGSLDIATEIRTLCDITVVSGDDSLTLPLMSIGATGVISVLSNLMPTEVAKLAKLAEQQKYTEAAALHRKLFPLIKALFVDGNPVGIKAAMKLAGRDTGELRLPLWEASEGARKLLAAEMTKLGILR
ncbi:MAG: 4-hydroxy-tetrahydrodipicolinate synthase [Tepidisphaeraceae bacterium]|jgi:4-hydroxy-tetrahydrodipicolinate synthase